MTRVLGRRWRYVIINDFLPLTPPLPAKGRMMDVPA